MSRKLLFAMLILIIVFISGCTQQQTNLTGFLGQGKNFIQLEFSGDYEAIKGRTAYMNILIRNTANTPVKNILVTIPHFGNFSVIDVSCGAIGVRQNNGCFFAQLESEGSDEIRISLKAPEIVGKEEVSINAKYDYSGSSVLKFNIWDSKEGEQWGRKDFTSSEGPIRVNIISDFSRKKIIKGKVQTVTDWIEDDAPMVVKFEIKNIGGPGIESPDITIPKENFKIKLIGLSPNLNDCDLVEAGGLYIIKENKVVSAKQSPIVYCVLFPDDVRESEHWKPGLVEVEYSYRYEFVKKREFPVIDISANR